MEISKTVQRNTSRYMGSSYFQDAYYVSRLRLALLGEDDTLDELFTQGEKLAKGGIVTIETTPIAPTPSLLHSAELAKHLEAFTGRAILLIEDPLIGEINPCEEIKEGYLKRQLCHLNLPNAEVVVRNVRANYGGPVLYGYKPFKTEVGEPLSSTPNHCAYLDAGIGEIFDERFRKHLDGTHRRDRATELAFLASRPETLRDSVPYAERERVLSAFKDYVPECVVRILTPFELGGRFLPVIQFNPRN